MRSHLTTLCRAAALASATLACAAQPRSPRLNAQPPCPPPAQDTLGGRLEYVAFVVDGRLLPSVARQVTRGPHSAMLLDTLPEVAAIKPSDIHEVTPVRGPGAAAEYNLCPGHALVIITTKRAAERR